MTNLTNLSIHYRTYIIVLIKLKNMKNVTINKEQKLYVITSGNGYTCLGFDVLYKRITALAEELNLYPLKSKKKGTLTMYKEYKSIISKVAKMNKDTGFKSKSELIPEFIGKEGYRVQVVDKYDETRRFIIGKSTGFIPCHLEISKSNSIGGISVYGHPFKSIQFLEIV